MNYNVCWISVCFLLPAFILSCLCFCFVFLPFATVPEVKVSEQTPSDELARKMRNYSGRSECMRGGGVWGFPMSLSSFGFVWN